MGLRPCLAPRCPVLVTSGRCEAHGGPRRPWAAKATTTPRLTGRANQRRRALLFTREPLCRECAKHNRVTIATIRDHVIPLAEGGTEDVTNEQPLCNSCHLAKSEQESKRGSARARQW